MILEFLNLEFLNLEFFEGEDDFGHRFSFIQSTKVVGHWVLIV